jgi:hypothetical protein
MPSNDIKISIIINIFQIRGDNVYNQVNSKPKLVNFLVLKTYKR